MKMNKNLNVLIVGLGLLGGSYAMALKNKGYKVFAITKEQEDIDFAIEKGIIDGGSAFVDKQLLNTADLIIFALYPEVFVNWIKENGKYIPSGAIVTDVTGVKGEIVEKVQIALEGKAEFISAHPMAGREVGGIKNADCAIFNGANYIVVPTEKNSEDATELCCDLGKELGFSRIAVLSVNEHDEMIAFLSQLTHCIAVSLMCCSDNERLVEYTGDSFRDLTRIAKINDEMWSELFLMNKSALLKQMDIFTQRFDDLKNALKNDDRETMREMMRCSTHRRAAFDRKEEN